MNSTQHNEVFTARAAIGALHVYYPLGFPPGRTEEMDRKEMLRLLLDRAQFNGFDFRRWFQARVQPHWPGAEMALSLLASEGRHYTLLFSHDFASHFWRAGCEMTFLIPSMTYSRVNTQGDVVQVTRKPFTRRTIKPDVWRYHLRQMAVAEDPMEYLERFLPVQGRPQVPDSRPAPIAVRA
jgi:hypothetical protein